MSKVAILVPILSVFSFTVPAHADLVAWWPLDGLLEDASGNGMDASVIGDPQFDGDALRFGEGDTEGLRIDAADTLDADIFSLGYRLNQDGAVQGNAGLERLTSRAGDTFETAIGDANVLEGGTTSETGTTLSYYQGTWNRTDVEIPSEGWVHVVWQNTATEMVLYIDGESVYTGAPVPSGQISGFMNIGLRHNDIEGYEGLIDDVFLWDDSTNPLSAEDIASIAAEGMNAFLGLDTDSDQDGLPDPWEITHGLDPEDDGSTNPDNGAEGDPDGDGLTNAEEFELGTSPQESDTDGDGLSDGDEVDGGTNPRFADPDRDGVTDAEEEIELGTDPNHPDSDGDGFLDGFEVANGFDPLDDTSRPRGDSLLVLHLDFDGSLEDLSGFGHDGAPLGEPEFSSDTPTTLSGGQSLRLGEGDTHGVTIEPSDLLNSDTFTLAYFINQDGAVQGNAGLERLTSRGGDVFETAIGDGSGVGGSEPGTLSYYSPVTGWRLTGVIVPESGWVHVAWRNKGTGPEDMELFLNGESAFVGPGVIPGAAGLMNIGIRHSVIEGYEGLIDELRFYSAPLTDEEMIGLPLLGASGTQIRDIQLSEGALSLTWTSSAGQFFDIQKSFSMLTGEWESVVIQLPAAASPDEETTHSLETEVGEGTVFYRVARVAPPALYEDDLESGGEDWTVGVIEGFAESATSWEIGEPLVGPGAAHSGSNVFGTGLTENYASDTGIFLRTPVIDFTGRGATRLSFWHYADVPFGEGGRLNIRDASGGLIQSLKIYDVRTEEWTEDVVRLPEINAPATIEFEFLSDGDASNNGAGWFIDDLRIE